MQKEAVRIYHMAGDSEPAPSPLGHLCARRFRGAATASSKPAVTPLLLTAPWGSTLYPVLSGLGKACVQPSCHVGTLACQGQTRNPATFALPVGCSSGIHHSRPGSAEVINTKPRNNNSSCQRRVEAHTHPLPRPRLPLHSWAIPFPAGSGFEEGQVWGSAFPPRTLTSLELSLPQEHQGPGLQRMPGWLGRGRRHRGRAGRQQSAALPPQLELAEGPLGLQEEQREGSGG